MARLTGRNGEEVEATKQTIKSIKDGRKTSRVLVVLAVIVVFVAVIGILIGIRNKCANLEMSEKNFLNSVDKCYISGDIDKERKDYLTDKYQKTVKDQISSSINHTVDITDTIIGTGIDNKWIQFSSLYCDNRDDHCAGCRLNFYNNNFNARSIIFTNIYKYPSVLNFLSEQQFLLLGDKFCYDLDCGEGLSEPQCFNKKEARQTR
jgi:hypothetical protein